MKKWWKPWQGDIESIYVFFFLISIEYVWLLIENYLFYYNIFYIYFQLLAVVAVLRGMRLWLEEPRLYESGIYLPALPPNLLPDKLLHIFQVQFF